MKGQDLYKKLSIIEKEIEKIKIRNDRVETEKAWETSWARRICIAIFTYISIGLFMYVIKVDKPWLNAIIPTTGFMLSTLSLPYIKNRWIKTNRNE